MHFNFSKPVVHGNIGKLQVSDVKVEFQILIRVGLLIRPGNNPKWINVGPTFIPEHTT